MLLDIRLVSSCRYLYFCNSFFYSGIRATYTTRTITVPASTGVISDVNFAVGLTHSYLSDVQMEVVSPQGTTVKLFDRSCGATNSSLVLNYDDLGSALACGTTTVQTVSPFESLAAFNGQNPQGIWTFRVRDVDAGMIGTIEFGINNYLYANLYFSCSLILKSMILFCIQIQIKEILIFNLPVIHTSAMKVLVHDLLGRKIFENEFENNQISMKISN